mmetsp:Transcript_20423/g.65296  ORF Transcript_20423/g.65296 Transcript_20423/m.65296 type:complete len:242 (-) Transcript_20423:941-1666(-)
MHATAAAGAGAAQPPVPRAAGALHRGVASGAARGPSCRLLARHRLALHRLLDCRRPAGRGGGGAPRRAAHRSEVRRDCSRRDAERCGAASGRRTRGAAWLAATRRHQLGLAQARRGRRVGGGDHVGGGGPQCAVVRFAARRGGGGGCTSRRGSDGGRSARLEEAAGFRRFAKPRVHPRRAARGEERPLRDLSEIALSAHRESHDRDIMRKRACPGRVHDASIGTTRATPSPIVLRAASTLS